MTSFYYFTCLPRREHIRNRQPHGIWLWKIYSPHLPRTPDDGDIICILVSVGTDVITPQRRFACAAQAARAPQGSPQVFRGPWGSIFKPPCSHRAPKCRFRGSGWRRSLRTVLFITSWGCPSSRRAWFAHTWGMYRKCRLFSCQCTKLQ